MVEEPSAADTPRPRRTLAAPSESAATSVQKDVLPNGLTIVTERMANVRSVSVGIWLRSGSRSERQAENGISHFLEHMVFKGTKNRSAEEIARAADSIGGHLDAFTAKECTSFSIKVLDEHLPRAMDILSDLVKNPLLQPEDIAKECQVIQEEIKMVEDAPDDLVHEIFTQSYWRDSPLGRPILGTRQTVKGINRRRLLEYFHRHYVPSNTLIAAAGHLEHGQLVDLVLQSFGDAAAGAVASEERAPAAHPHIGYRRKKDLEQVHLCLGTPAYPQSHEKRYACYILNTVLGGGMSSRLFQNIREKRGLAYAIFSNLNNFRDAGCLNVYAGIATQNIRKVVRLILKEFRQLRSSPIGDEELQRAKDYLKGSLLLSLESTMSRMSSLARQEMYFGRYISLDEIAERVDAVTAGDLREVARDLFQSDRIALTILGPSADIKMRRADLEC
jgi:predicted Zn-dependent peptidase